MPDHAGNVVPAGGLSASIIRGDGSVEKVELVDPSPVTQSVRFDNAVRLGLDETCSLEDAEAGARAGTLLPLYLSSAGPESDDGSAGTPNGIFMGVFHPSPHGLAHLVGVGADDENVCAAEARRLAYAATLHGQPVDPYVEAVEPVVDA
jgi:hypothetical protein